MPTVCTNRLTMASDVNDTFRPCTACGHAMVVHGGPHQPDVTECVLCRGLADVDAIRPAMTP